MTNCFIKFEREIVKGSIGNKKEVESFLRNLKGCYDFEGVQQVRNRELHINESVLVYSYSDYEYGTAFVCHKL